MWGAQYGRSSSAVWGCDGQAFVWFVEPCGILLSGRAKWHHGSIVQDSVMANVELLMKKPARFRQVNADGAFFSPTHMLLSPDCNLLSLFFSSPPQQSHTFLSLSHSPHSFFIKCFFLICICSFLSVRYSVWKYFIVVHLKHTCFIYSKKKHHQRRSPQMKWKHEWQNTQKPCTNSDGWLVSHEICPPNQITQQPDRLKRFRTPAIAIVSVHVFFYLT